jgi:hypothetical protein
MVNMNDTTARLLFLMSLASLLVLALTAIVVFTIRDTIRGHGNWNLKAKRAAFCPLCGHPAPAARLPKNLRQALWGTFTCAKCGLEYCWSGRAVDEDERQRRLDELDETPYARTGYPDLQQDERVQSPGQTRQGETP